MQKKENGMAIAGFVCSLCGAITCGISSIVGLILSIIGLKKSKNLDGKGKGLSIAGIVISSIIIVIAIVILVLNLAVGMFLFKNIDKEIKKDRYGYNSSIIYDKNNLSVEITGYEYDKDENEITLDVEMKNKGQTRYSVYLKEVKVDSNSAYSYFYEDVYAYDTSDEDLEISPYSNKDMSQAKSVTLTFEIEQNYDVVDTITQTYYLN